MGRKKTKYVRIKGLFTTAQNMKIQVLYIQSTKYLRHKVVVEYSEDSILLTDLFMGFKTPMNTGSKHNLPLFFILEKGTREQ